MKIFIPRHIQGGFFNMNLQLGPLTLNLIQLFILAIGGALTMGIWNGLYKATGDKMIAFILAAPIFLIFIAIAFFKLSELTLIPFIAKLIKTYILDETKKYQVNFQKIDPLAVCIGKLKSVESKQVIQHKDSKFDKEKMDHLSHLID